MQQDNLDRYYSNQFSHYYELNENNKAARKIVALVYRESTIIDPLTKFSAAITCIALDRMGIYNEDLVKLYTELCDENIEYLFSLTKAFTQKIITRDGIHKAIQNINSLSARDIHNLLSNTPFNKINAGEDHEKYKITS